MKDIYLVISLGAPTDLDEPEAAFFSHEEAVIYAEYRKATHYFKDSGYVNEIVKIPLYESVAEVIQR